MRLAVRFWPVVALLLGGCLLPQPDTPVIPPFAAPGSMSHEAAPAMAPVPTGEQLAAGAAPTNEITKAQPNNDLLTPSTAPAVLAGRIEGLTLTRLVAVADTPERASQTTEVDAAGAFTLSLPAGGYFLELEVDGQTLRVDKRLSLAAGETRSITLMLQAKPPRATLKEEAALVAPTAAGQPSVPPAGT